MAEESKQVKPSAEEIGSNVPKSAVAAGKQPAVDSEDESDGPEEAVGDQAADTGTGASSKKKKSRRKKIKEAITGSSKTDDPQEELRRAIANLPPGHLAELLKQNPALSQELSSARAEGSAGGASTDSAIEALRRLSLADVMTGLASSGKNVKDMGSYKFWQTQPVPKFGEKEETSKAEDGPIRVQTVDEVPKEPPKLIEGFEWDTVDLTDEEQLKEVYELLNGHYVEDDAAMFRFKYSTSILKWAILSPGWTKDWHVGVRATQSRKLVAFIAAIPIELRVRDKVLHSSEVNFLVVHKKLRAKRLTPVLIKEITRKCNLKEVWQAIYTAGIVLPKPVSTCRYFHRALNWQKLNDVGFSPLPANSKPQYQIRKYALPDNTALKGIREIKAKDLPAVGELLNRYLKRYQLAGEYTAEEWKHWLLDKKDPGDEQVVFSYVVEDENKKITDFISYYSLESSVIQNPKHSVVRAAYLFYYATEVGLTTPPDKPALKKRLNVLVNDALILAKQQKFDVFNALSLMDNALFLEQQKFGQGDGQLHFYLFNYRTDPIAGGVNKKNQLDEDFLSGIGLTMM